MQKTIRPSRISLNVLALFVSLAPCCALLPAETPDDSYFPPRGEWLRRSADEVGMDADGLAAAIEFARSHETPVDPDIHRFIETSLANEPHGEIVGPTRSRGASNGVIVKDGYIVAEWGPTKRVDMTFSVTKSYLSTVVGLAVDRGLIPDVNDPVAELVQTEHFESERNAGITWDHLLRQTSDWRGEQWGKHGWADRPPKGATLEEMQAIPLREPGSAWEYNDVRVNLLAFAALQVWRTPLPRVLRRQVMDPIGASPTWRWHGYSTSWTELDGSRVQSVSGGGHWGGGMFICTLDHARFGYLFLRGGVWNGKRLISQDWIDAARTPTEPRQTYGYMNWFLNTPGVDAAGNMTRPLPAAPESAVTFRGAGSNIIYIDWENDLVVVVRWIDRNAFPRLIEMILASQSG